MVQVCTSTRTEISFRETISKMKNVGRGSTSLQKAGSWSRSLIQSPLKSLK